MPAYVKRSSLFRNISLSHWFSVFCWLVPDVIEHPYLTLFVGKPLFLMAKWAILNDLLFLLDHFTFLEVSVLFLLLEGLTFRCLHVCYKMK